MTVCLGGTKALSSPGSVPLRSWLISLVSKHRSRTACNEPFFFSVLVGVVQASLWDSIIRDMVKSANARCPPECIALLRGVIAWQFQGLWLAFAPSFHPHYEKLSPWSGSHELDTGEAPHSPSSLGVVCHVRHSMLHESVLSDSTQPHLQLWAKFKDLGNNPLILQRLTFSNFQK